MVTPGPGQFILMTLRSHDQFNTTIFGLDDRYRGIRGTRRILMMHPDDISEQGFVPHQVVEIQSAVDAPPEMRRFRLHPHDIPRRCVAAYFPEANYLVPMDRRDPESHTPASKSTLVAISGMSGGDERTALAG